MSNTQLTITLTTDDTSDVPPSYKRTEVGVIPEDWRAVKLGSLADILRGASPRPIDSPIWFDEQSSTGWLRISDVTSARKYLTETTQNLSDAGIAKSRLVEQGNLVMSICATVGRPIITRKDVCIHDGFVVFDGLRDNHEYLYYVLSNIEGDWSKHGQTGSQMNLNTGLINSTFIPLPPPIEQHAIAEALRDVDALIQSLDELIAKKRAIKQAIMQQLLTGKQRLRGFSREWQQLTLSEVADKQIPFSFAGGPFGSNLKASEYTSTGIRIIQLQNIGDGVFHDDYAIYTSEEKANELKSCNIFPGEIIISKMGDPVARACLVPTQDSRYLMASDGIRLAVDKRRFCTRFVLEYINFTEFRNRALEGSTGSTRMRIGLNDLKRLLFTAPELQEQIAIAAILSDMDAEIVALEQRRDKTRQMKQGMMQQLLTGRMRLVKRESAAVQLAAVQHETRAHNQQINEAVVIAMLAEQFADEEHPLGRKRYTKLSYLLHRYAEGRADGYAKHAAGPYNPQTRYGGPEKIAINNHYIREHAAGPYQGYVVGSNIAQAEGYFDRWYGAEARQWLEQFRYISNDDLELLATVDMAAEELREAGSPVTVAMVKQVILSNQEWAAKLTRSVFSDQHIARAITTCHKLFGPASEEHP